MIFFLGSGASCLDTPVYGVSTFHGMFTAWLAWLNKPCISFIA